MQLVGRKPRSTATKATRSQRSLDAESACRAVGITDPAAELPLLIELAGAARRYRTTSCKLAAARKAWGAFAATGADDDPAHEEHRQKLVAARAAHTAADEEFAVIEHRLAVARGDVPAAAPTGRAVDRAATAKRLVAAAEGRA